MRCPVPGGPVPTSYVGRELQRLLDMPQIELGKD